MKCNNINNNNNNKKKKETKEENSSTLRILLDIHKINSVIISLKF